jgi:hypothetical protein
MTSMRRVGWALLALSLTACSSSATNDNANGGAAGSSAGGGAGGSEGGITLSFPQTPVIDDFEYTGLATSEKWSAIGAENNWSANGVLSSTTSNPTTLFTLASFGAKQEAYMQITKLPPSGGVYLLFSGKPCESGYVKYDMVGSLHVGTEAQTGACTDVDVAVDPLELAEGDQLGVRTRGDKKIDVFVNGEPFKTYDFIADAGPLGLGADLTGAPTDSVVSIDNFGGGSLP